MADTLFLTIQEVLEIHEDQIRRYGGTNGIREISLLESAIAMPASGIGDDYLHEDVCDMAAAYLFHIARNHPFVDGNKRTAAVAAVIFLALNGIEVVADEDEFERVVWAVARGEVGKQEAASFLRGSCRPEP